MLRLVLMLKVWNTWKLCGSSVALCLFHNGGVQAKTVVQPQQDASGEYLDEAVDYMMLDNHEIYAYLAEN